ncbi:hypothetical protein V6N13_104957 [Hibiscus sabdariffa]|uniref:Uncharacterized protein n=2 Tax=Hibiscus sabdariffa TaxID=183260 RepID=A0ABR2SII5_9ROSI
MTLPCFLRDTSLPRDARSGRTNHLHELTFTLLQVLQVILRASNTHTEILIERLHRYRPRDFEGHSQTPSRGFRDSRGSKKVVSVQPPRARQRFRHMVRKGSLIIVPKGSNDGSTRASLLLVCEHCGRKHFEVCFLLHRVYYRCRVPCHMVKDYSIFDDVTPVQSQRFTPCQRGKIFTRARAKELS